MIRLGTRVFVTMPAPNPASVGARQAAASTANQMPSAPKTRRAASAPATTVKGSPIPSSRAGRPMSRRSDVSRRRAESENRISTKVISAVVLMVDADSEISKVLSAPKARPPSVKTIGAVMPILSACPETTVHSTTRVATIARSAHVTTRHPGGSNCIHEPRHCCDLPVRWVGTSNQRHRMAAARRIVVEAKCTSWPQNDERPRGRHSLPDTTASRLRGGMEIARRSDWYRDGMIYTGEPKRAS